MPVRPMLSIFSAGELSPLLNGRIDLSTYYKGCSQLENFLPIKQGGVTRRPGTIFVTSTYSSSISAEGCDNIVRLIPFIISETMGFVWEFTDQQVAGGLQARVFYDHALVVSLTMPSLFTLESQYLQINKVMYLVHEDHPVYKLTYASLAGWSVGTVDFTASTGEEGFSLTEHYPRTIAFHQDRIIFGGTETDPHKIWGSAVGDHENFTQGAGLAADAFELEIGARLRHQIQWIESAEDLVVGTDQAEGILYGSPEEGLTPATAFFRWISTRGSAYFQPTFVDGAIIFIDRSQKQVFQLYNDGGWKTNDLTIFADHIAGDGIGEDPAVPSFAQYEGEEGGFCQAVMFQREPHPYLWCVTKTGELACCAFDKDSGLIAWSRHITEPIGTTPSANANYYGKAFFRSVAIIPNILGRDELWAQVTRWHNDNLYKNYLEYFAPIKFENLEDGHFVDAGVETELSPPHTFTEITGYYQSGNLVLDPENGTTGSWTVTSLTPSLADLYFIGMRYTKLLISGGANGALEQRIYYSGNGTKLVQGIIRRGSTPNPDYVQIYLYDVTASATRGDIKITWATKEVEAAVAGTIVGEYWINNSEVWVAATFPNVVATNNNSLRVYVHGVTGEYAYCTGIQTQDTDELFSGIKLGFKPIVTDIADGDSVLFSGINPDNYPDISTVLSGKNFVVSNCDPWYKIQLNSVNNRPAAEVDAVNGLGLFRKVDKIVTSLAHLEAKSIAINTDGFSHPNKTVANGQISLDIPASFVHAGLPYYPRLRTMPLEVASQIGTSQALKGRIPQLFVRFHRTVSAKIGYSEDDTLETVRMREWSDEWGNINQEPFTGDRQVDFPEGYLRDKYIYVTSETATAITILGLIPDLQNYQG